MSSKKQRQMAVRELSEVGAVEQRCLQLPSERQQASVGITDEAGTINIVSNDV